LVKVSPGEKVVPSGMVTSLTNETQSQYVTAVAVGGGVFVAGTGVLVGMAVGGNGVCVGAYCVWAATVCVTMA